ncbi:MULTISPECIES: aromatic ring-hydroxylating dioxygenase subunit alpha [unclassified Roseovarius]|uniref:aromatic ring-hydroxylating oxygenase subunit alpha n=1 Tax=unclassified Roseovarius TaxID=2614913 RepID=UPI00273E6C7D|nr:MULTISPECIES: aromatic ring-hydroxylating dioxygenase subunit alpha [unclassified Roseovarius]
MSERLPKEAYTTAAWFETESKTVFGQAWTFVGTTHDFAQAGDFRTVMCGADRLFAVRDKEGRLNAFHNHCRHRGAELVDGENGNCGGALVCPYHRWTYGLDGALRGVPNKRECFPDLDRTELGLLPAAVGVFKDLVFVNPDAGADFETWIAPLMGKEWPHDLSASDIKDAVPLVYDMKCDWKVYVENAIDGYHLAYLHENTLGGPLPGMNEWERAGQHMIWSATEDGIRHRLPQKIRDEAGSTGMIESASTPGYGGVYYLFPSTLVVPTPYGMSVSSLQPVSAGRCRMHVRQWVGPWQSTDERAYIPGYDKASGIISSEHWTKPPLETGDFQTEDVWICEKVQRGLESPAYRHGPLSQGAGAEDPIRWFHETLAPSSHH